MVVTETRSPLKDSFDRKYRIERQVGRGGMANVFLARDLKHDRPVAVKILKPEIASVVGGGDRFLREIRTMARLHHPHILTLHDSGSMDGALYYVMPFVEGESLRDRLDREGRVPFDRAVRFAREVADALVYAHGEGVVHRDIKPENILLAGDHAIVADFGIARAIFITAGERLTDSGFVLGTPAYMSPEQASGSGEIDGRSDVYSLGITLYEMLTGTRPTPSAGMRLGESAGRTTPPEFRADLPGAVRRVLAKAIAPVPDMRYATAAEFRDALDELLPRRGRGPGSQLLRGAGAALGVAAVLGLLWFAIGKDDGNGEVRGRAESYRVAVTPFDIPDSGSSLAKWRVQFADDLGGAVDRVAGLRTVPLIAVSRRWGRIEEHPPVDELGRQLGARFVVTGTIGKFGRDSVSVSLTARDLERDRIRSLEYLEADDRIIRLIRPAAVELLRTLGEWGAVGATRGAPVAVTDNLDALQAFLDGEQAFRESNWPEALAHHRRALAKDSTLAVSARRLGSIAGWIGLSSDTAPLAWKLRAGALNRGQAARDSLLILADSLAAAAEEASADPVEAQFTRRMYSTHTAAVEAYPEDAEVRFALGDALYHQGSSYFGVTQRSILNAFEEAIQRDSAFTPSYIHATELGFALGGRPLGERYARAFLKREPIGVQVGGIRLVMDVLDAGGARTPAGRALLAKASGDTLYAAWAAVSLWPDSGELPLALSLRMDEGDTLFVMKEGAMPVPGSPVRPPSLRTARQLAYFGHVRRAAAALAARLASEYAVAADYRLLTELALLGAFSPDSASATFVRAVQQGRIRRATYGLPLWSKLRDTASIAAFVRATASAGDSVPRHEVEYARAAGPAYLALASGDTGTARTLFNAIPAILCMRCLRVRLTHAELLIGNKRYDEAMRILDEPAAYLQGALLVQFAATRARAHELRGERAEARRLHQYVADAWARADPELRASVDSARAGVRRLTP